MSKQELGLAFAALVTVARLLEIWRGHDWATPRGTNPYGVGGGPVRGAQPRGR